MCLGTEAISRKHIHFRPLILAILFLIESDMLPIYERVQHFNFQLMHTTLKIVELLKHFKISKTAVLLILKCFNNSTIFNVVCISWKLKC